VLRCALVVTAEREVSLDVRNTAAQPPQGQEREIITREGRLRVPILGGLGTLGAPPARGPAFLAAPDTTIFVPDGWSITFSEQGYGILTKEG
jgi:hypothetical protein